MHDSFWKHLIEKFFPDFMGLYFPSAFEKINWKRKFVFLDKELEKISPKNISGKKFVDKLVKVFLKSGKEEWILVHIEIQNTQDKNFEKRMYVYNYRIFDKYEHKVASFALLCDESKTWKPEKYEYELLGCKILLEYPTAKLLEYRSKQNELSDKQNAFADITLAYLSAIDTKDSMQKRYEKKIILIKKLYEKGYSDYKITEVFLFIDFLVSLPEALEKKIILKIHNLEEIKKVEYISSVERISRKQGMKEGISETKTSFVLKMLDRGLDMKLISDISGLSESAITALKQKRTTYSRKKQPSLAVKETTGKKK